MDNRLSELLKTDNYLGLKKYFKEGGDITDTNDAGESVLACAIRAKCSFDTLMLLVDFGADIFDFDDEGVSVFDIAITYDDREMVRYLIEKGRDVNQTSRRSGFTPLMAAACYGRAAIANILMQNGADQFAKDSKGFTAIDFARKMNKKSVLKLFEYDANTPQNKGYAR